MMAELDMPDADTSTKAIKASNVGCGKNAELLRVINVSARTTSTICPFAVRKGVGHATKYGS